MHVHGRTHGVDTSALILPTAHGVPHNIVSSPSANVAPSLVPLLIIILLTLGHCCRLSRTRCSLQHHILVPSPLSPTNPPLPPNVLQTVKDFKGGKVEYRLDKTGNLHVLFGRADFKEEQMLENLKAIQV